MNRSGEHGRSRPGSARLDEARFARLHGLLSIFAGAATRAEVGAAALDGALPLLGAQAGAVHLVSEDDRRLELLAVRGFPAVVQPLLAAVPLDARLPVTEAVRRQEPVWVESAEAMAAYGRVDLAVAGAGGGFACVPLEGAGRIAAVLTLAFGDSPSLGELDHGSVLGFAGVCAQALDRARLVEVERQARLDAEAASRRLRLLAEASTVLSSSLDWESTVTATARLALGSFADWCVVDVLDDAGVLRRVAVEHANPERRALADELRHLPPGTTGPAISDALHEGRPQHVAVVDVEAFRAAAGGGDGGRVAELALALGLGSYVLAPMSARGRMLGVLSFMRGMGAPPYGRDDVSLAELLARRAALAVDNARLFREARLAEDESRRAAERLRILAEASLAFAEAKLDLEAALQAVARKTADLIGDACVLSLLDETGHALVAAAFHHQDERSLELARDLAPLAVPSGDALLGEALRTGRPVRADRVDDGLRARLAPPVRTYVERLGAASVLAAPLKVDGQPIGTLCVARGEGGPPYTSGDESLLQAVAARASLVIQKAQLYQAAQEAIRVRDDFLSIAGHELRTPLTALELQAHSVLEKLRAGQPAAEVLPRAEKMVGAIGRLDALVRQLLDVSRITAGRLTLDRERLDLAAVASEVAQRASEQLARSGCECRLSAAAPVWGCWDRLRLEEIVSNLLSNAMKYGRGKPIEVDVRAAGERALLTVTDHGMGIQREDQARIFNRFERAVTSRHFGGFGLGLWITRQIVEAHGGTVRVESEPGQGASFFIELPLATPEEARVA